jgi:hypothetical protein
VFGLEVAIGILVPGLISADKKVRIPAPQAVLAGSVFRDSGFSLRGAEIVVTPAEPDRKKKVEWRATSDARGEFAVRLPPGPASYNVIVRASGYRPQQKTVTFAADERHDFSFLLEPDGEKK